MMPKTHKTINASANASSEQNAASPPLSPVITIDGPSGSGKGTISLLLARALGWHFLDSGAVYRVLAWSALANGLNLSDEDMIECRARALHVTFNGHIICENQDITKDIRSEACGNAASKIAAFPKVRTALLERQRDFRKSPGLVADGRDMGTVVFQDAFLKIYLEASPLERAKRRYLQLKDTFQGVTLQGLLTEIEIRDRRDKERAVAPLKPAEDAVVIDTTGLGIEAVFDIVMQEVKQRFHQS